AVLAMLAVGVYVVVEAISRLGDAPEVASGAMLAVGFAGLVINIISMLLLRSGAKDSLNVKGAYYEVIADAAGSVGVMVAGVLIILTGQPIWDVVVAALIAVFVII
ncbi:cation transporter, partial [Micrococcus luteus]